MSGPFLCFECSEPKEIVMTIHRLYNDRQEAQERIKKIKELGYKNAAAIDLGDSGIRIPFSRCQAKLNSSPVSIINKQTFTTIGKDVG